MCVQVWIHVILSLISWHEGAWRYVKKRNDRVSDNPNDRTGPQASTSGSGIGAVAYSRHLPSGCARLARVQASKIHIDAVQLCCLPRQLASLWEERTREGRTSNSASIRVLVLLQEALLCSPRCNPQSSVEARAAATDIHAWMLLSYLDVFRIWYGSSVGTMIRITCAGKEM